MHLISFSKFKQQLYQTVFDWEIDSSWYYFPSFVWRPCHLLLTKEILPFLKMYENL